LEAQKILETATKLVLKTTE